VDAAVFGDMCRQSGVPAVTLINAAATLPAVSAAAAAACSGLKPGGLLILFGSSHGAQRQDFDGDEPDGRDEAICLYDGAVTDDVVWSLLSRVPPGVRVWMVTDCCHSGTNFRGRPARYAAGVQSRISGLRSTSSLLPSPSSFPRLLHWGGCEDGRYSYGSPQGGIFTSALVDAWREGQTYAEWFAGAKARLPNGNQTPTCEEVGESFAGLPAFQ
jgi:hypothetical protein